MLIVTRWVRYGHDRLYVKSGDGAQLGYRDNKAGTDHVEAGVDPERFRAALGAYWAAGGKPAPAAAAERPADPLAAVDRTEEQRAWEQPIAEQPAEEQPAAAGRHAAPEPEAPVERATPAPEPSWTDLSLSRPGAAARDQALAKRAEAPVRTMLARVLGVHTDERAWRIGADGEELVAAQLQRLGPAWKVLHAVPVGERGSDIDHVLIGPGGVYTVNSKHHPDASVWVGGNTVIVNGSKTWYVRNSRHEARRAAGILSGRAGFPVQVTGLIAMICPRDRFTVKSQPPGGDVVVLARRKLVDWLAGRGPVLSPEQVEALFEVARRSTTWAG